MYVYVSYTTTNVLFIFTYLCPYQYLYLYTLLYPNYGGLFHHAYGHLHLVSPQLCFEVSMPSRIVDVNGRWFEALRTTTQQPNLAPWMI